jgi:cation-transporting P-type ATPase E
MIGDGVNDARALKGAQVGVAMRSGSAVTRDVADIVLVDDSFAALLPAQREGRRIINGIAVSMYVFLTRVATQGVVILAVTMLGLGFPYSPTQVGLTLLTVGVPTLFLTFWARPVPPDEHLLGNLARFVVPAAVITGGFGTAVYAALYQRVTEGVSSGRTPAEVIGQFESYTGLAYTDSEFTEAAATIGAQTGLSTFVCLASFVLILFLAPAGPVLRRLDPAHGRPAAGRAGRGAGRGVRRRAVRAGPVELLRADRAGPAGVHHRAARLGAVVRRTQRRLPVPAAGPDPGAQRASGR